MEVQLEEERITFTPQVPQEHQSTTTLCRKEFSQKEKISATMIAFIHRVMMMG
jgi:hypothetical protein